MRAFLHNNFLSLARLVQPSSRLCRALLALFLAIVGLVGEASAQEYITLSGLDTYTRVNGGASVTISNQKRTIKFDAGTLINHGDNWVIYSLPCIGAGNVLNFDITVLKKDRAALGDEPQIVVIQLNNTYNVTDPLNVDARGETNVGYLTATNFYTKAQNGISVALNPSAKYVAICFDARHKTLTAEGKIENIKMTKRKATVTYVKTGEGDGTLSVTNSGASISSGSQVYVCDVITFTATPDDCSLFAGWYDGTVLLSDQLTYTYPSPITSNLNIQARFNKKAAPVISCGNHTLLTPDGSVSIDLPTVQSGEVTSWSADHGLNVVGNKITGTLPNGETSVTIQASYCGYAVSCVSQINVIRKLPACE